MVVLKMWSETSSISITQDLFRNTDSQVPPRTAETEKLQMGSRNLGLTSSLGHSDAQPYSDRIVLFFQNVLLCKHPTGFSPQSWNTGRKRQSCGIIPILQMAR